MIWYLLYPFRGTTEAPFLDPTHPLRNTFTRYGRYVARHVVTTLLVSVAVAVILIYPFPYLYTTDFTNGASSLPHHVWTVAQPLDRKTSVEPDVIMRSIWVHGSYMKALDRDILLGALELQDELLGPTRDFDPRQPKDRELVDPGAERDLGVSERDAFHVVNGLTERSWFFHSPLQYWACSPDVIEHDGDIIATVNEKKTQPTSVNVTLRHSIVFSGKKFEERRLLAADALVITLIHLRDSPVGRQWERKAEALAARVADKWAIYPSDGRSMPSQLYEFQFRPISTEDTISLSLAYGLALAWTMFRVSGLRAVESKFGLMVTVMAQIVVSILSSFTVCAIFKIDLSMIPHAAYPIVILSMSLENIFRLINSVILTPSEDSTSSRIGYAFGETAHIALASTVQNCLLLWLLSKVVAPAVAHFCIFAAIAIVFDYFYLSTFFLSVLSVDVRRTELGDALAKASLRHDRVGLEMGPRPHWAEAMLRGRMAMSTRIAGTIITAGFVLMAQWHFFENDSMMRVLGQILAGGDKMGVDEVAKLSQSSLLEDIHQARSPTSWLRLQDHETAKEVIHVVKPDTHSYVARVFEPLVFVRRGADRVPREVEGTLLPAVYDFLHHQLTTFILTILVALAAVRLLTNYLLSDEGAGSKAGDDDDDEPLLSVRTDSGGHTLDVVLMSASADGHVVSVGLDRDVRVWNVQLGADSQSIVEAERPRENHFPVLAMAIDDASSWLALLGSSRIMTWNLAEQRWGPSLPLDNHNQKVEAFFFGYPRAEYMYPLVVVWRGGGMTQLWPETGESINFVLCKSPLVSVQPLVQKSFNNRSWTRLSILTASKRSCVHHAVQGEDGWTSDQLTLPASQDSDVHQVVPLAEFNAMLVARSRSVQLMDAQDYRLIHTFATEAMQPRSLKCHFLSRRKLQCGSLGMGAMGLVYAEAETGDCVIQTYRPREEGDTICFQDASAPSCGTCCPWTKAKESSTHVTNPGKWEALPNGCVVGVRKANHSLGPENHGGATSSTARGLRRRLYHNHHADPPKSQPDRWDVWLASQLGRQSIHETRPLHAQGDEGRHLMINELGPMVKVGMSSVAVGFGNEIKLITVGHERFGDSLDALGSASLPGPVRRHRRPAGTPRPRISSRTFS